ncbi:MAG TPA: FAD-dependent oxidoreductase, partial [Phycisphaerales bacterium]|nr:FAD-dependent oxidoreductase [Phycisphaerales bacterium]
MGSVGTGRLRVVIVGGGFAGLELAKHLKRAQVDITLVDRRNHHLFQPLLYQVATASLSPADIAWPIRHVLSKQKNVRVLLAEATRIDADRKTLVLRDGEVGYDVLCLCCGVSHSYFGHPQWAELAPGLKSVEDAVEIRRRFLLAFEAAERETDKAARRAHLTFVIVGGGPTGVELAGAMAEIARRAIPADFRSIDTTTARIILVEGEKRVLAAMPESLSARALRDLKKLGVEVHLGKHVTEIDER